MKAKIKVPNEQKSIAMKNLEKELPQGLKDVQEILTVDGLGISLKQGWVLVRPSGTEPVIRITCEAQSAELVEAILNETKGIVEEVIGSL